MSKKDNEQNNAYTSKIIFSSFEMTAIEKISYRETTGCKGVADIVKSDGDKLDIHLAGYYHVKVHNEKAKDNTDYTVLVMLDASGERYASGSESLMTSLDDIMDLITDSKADGSIAADFIPTITIIARASKNYKDKIFLDCYLDPAKNK